MAGRLKILIEAYTCAPNRGSEPGLGWNVVSRLAERHEVYAIVEEVKWRESLETYCAQHPEETRHLHFFFIPKARYPFLRKIWPPSYYWFYRRWQKKALRLAKELDYKYHFDIVHHVTMAGFRAPGYLWKLGKPFVWGPIGGLNNTPWHLLPQLGLKGAFFYACRNLINAYEKRWNRDVRNAAKSASHILCSTEEDTWNIRRIWGCHAKYFCELGTERQKVAQLSLPHASDEPLKVIWVGLLTARKALPFLLRALALCRQEMELHVVGDGELRQQWAGAARRCPNRHRIIFHGKLAQSDTYELIKKSHVACISSVRDDTSTVTLEYLQFAIPVIALKHCGFGTVINEQCGIRIELNSPDRISRDIAGALDRLATDEELRMRLSRGAACRAEEFDWNGKIDALTAVYTEALNNS